jgi:hypothetical protein
MNLMNKEQYIERGIKEVKDGLAYMQKRFPQLQSTAAKSTLQSSYDDWANEYPIEQWLANGVAEALNLKPAQEWDSPDYQEFVNEQKSFQQ